MVLSVDEPTGHTPVPQVIPLLVIPCSRICLASDCREGLGGMQEELQKFSIFSSLQEATAQNARRNCRAANGLQLEIHVATG